LLGKKKKSKKEKSTNVNEESTIATLECDHATNEKEWKPVNCPIEYKENETWAKVTDLKPATCYKFRVIFSNVYGSAEPSKMIADSTISDHPVIFYVTSETICVHFDDWLFNEEGKPPKVKYYTVQQRISKEKEKEKDETASPDGKEEKKETDQEKHQSTPMMAMWKSILIKPEKEKNISEFIEGIIDNLTPDTLYEISVVATTTEGETISSKSVFTKTLPIGSAAQVGQPVIFEVGKTSCRVTWRALADDEKIKYSLEIDNGSKGTNWFPIPKEPERKQKKMQIVLDNLDPGKTYQIRVSATNEKGNEL